ncbi:hypothetical protein M0R45_036322 [Rubus argutus]|uniref:Uncharacterized protein n=1 Tax=Rubus argutus TaxID=59490 RepID=A0AAW1W1A5_RUBAR
MPLPPPLFDSKPNPDHNPANQFIPQNPRCQAQQRIVAATPDWATSTSNLDFSPSIAEVLGDVGIFAVAGDSVQFNDL